MIINSDWVLRFEDFLKIDSAERLLRCQLSTVMSYVFCHLSTYHDPSDRTIRYTEAWTSNAMLVTRP